MNTKKIADIFGFMAYVILTLIVISIIGLMVGAIWEADRETLKLIAQITFTAAVIAVILFGAAILIESWGNKS